MTALAPPCVDARAQPVSWNAALDQASAWYASAEAVRIADNVLLHQHANGGWPKNIDMARVLDEEDVDRLRREKTSRGNTTIDNGATYTQLRYLARVYAATGQARFRDGFLRGVDYLLAAQYENGGWPQYYPLREGYYQHITFNDGAMIGVLTLLRDVATGRPPFTFVDAERRARAAAAVARGIAVTLRMQVRQDGGRTVWCAQHDAQTLAPAWARAYEPPSLSGAESVGIVRFLMEIGEPTPEIIAAVEGAAGWLREAAIHGLRYEAFTDAAGRQDRRVVPRADARPLWARFYEIGSNRPIFLGRDSVVRYALAEIERERRGGYAYYGNWAHDLLTEAYPRWREKHGLSAD